MLAAALIVFREVLEAALIVSVILAATQGVKARLRFILGGIAAGLIGSFIVALFTNELASAFDGSGQDYFHAAIMFTVVALLGWHIVWMQSHGRALAQDMKKLGAAVVDGSKSLFVLAVVIALAVLREGSEVVLFVQGMMASGAMTDVLLGSTLGLGAGLAAGAVLYLGFLKLPIGKMFAATNVLLIFIAAGMAARGAGKLIQAGLIPAGADPLWDTSALLRDESLGGQFLGALTGYMAQPSAMQMVFYAVTVVGIFVLMRVQNRRVGQRV